MEDEANNHHDSEVVVYMEGEEVQRDVVRARVHPSVTVIPDRAFHHRSKLKEIELCEGLTEIGEQSFSQCSSLKHVNIPSTVKTIGSFACCGSPLQTLFLPDSIESIREYAFCRGRFPTARIPPLVTTIFEGTFSNCSSIFSAELPETLTQVVAGEYKIGGVFDNSLSLRNVAVPPHAVVDVNMFDGCRDLLQLFNSESRIVKALKHRFDNLPIHKMIYYHSYNNLTSEQLSNTINISSRQTLSHGNLNPTSNNQQDCLGMTPLHILACSTVQNIELYRVLIEKYPENLITEDRWGAVPLLYAVWGNASSEIVQLLAEKYKSIYPNYEFDWTGMITTLGERSAPESSIQSLLDLQEVSFPAQMIDWDRVLNTLANVVDTGSSAANASLKITFQILVKVSISMRVNAIGLKLWRDDMAEMTAKPIPRKQSKDDWLRDVKSKLSHYAAEYQQLKEATSTLELAFWKTKLDELNCQGGMGENTMSNKKRKIDDLELRSQCRISCGADIVIERVLPYLTELPAIVSDSQSDSQSDDDSSTDSFGLG